MKNHSLLAIALFIVGCAKEPKTPYDYVNPFFCTSGDHGQLFPGAVVPFGMAKLSPDTYPSGVDHKAHSGYNYLDERIMGFSHIRLGGEGCEGSGGNILLLPMIGKASLQPAVYASRYDKQSETAQPGYYKTTLLPSHINCELTVTEHAGFHRYLFPHKDSTAMIIDLGRGFTQIHNAVLSVREGDEIEGMVTAGHLCHSLETYTIYFSGKFNTKIAHIEWLGDATPEAGTQQISGTSIGAGLYFSLADNATILFKIGLSAVGVEQARQNRDSEIPNWDFDQVRRTSKKTWQDYLGKIQVEGKEEYKQLFYTSLYRSCVMPVNAVNADGSYRGTDRAVHYADGYTYYDSYSLWDTFRTKYPLLSLIAPAALQDIVRSFVAIYEQGGTHWPLPTVRREHMVGIIADAYSKGLRDFDIDQAYTGMRRDAFEMRAEFGNAAAGVKSLMSDSALKVIYEQYARLGYMPKRPDRTQENSYDNWCVAQMAKALHKEEDFILFSKRANNYRNVYNPANGFFCARDEKGAWLPFPDPKVIDETYVYEATMWQWRWFVLHDIPGLVQLLGSQEKSLSELSIFFQENLYNQNNEQDLHVPFLFNHVGAPWLTQEWVHKILAEPMTQLYASHGFYKTPYQGRVFRATPACYLPEMDDDCGTMSSWYVMAAMGLYQICPGSPVYELCSPIFAKTTINLDNNFYPGKSFTIEAKGLTEQNHYIQSALLNGQPYNKCYLSHQDLVKGGQLVYTMGAEPNKNWGVE
jgi:predicted alpha-1,2-mannosidase